MGFLRSILFRIDFGSDVSGIKSGYFGILDIIFFDIGNSIKQYIFEIILNNRNIYDEVLVIDTYTNELVASRELERPLVRRLK